jgi:addiction module RelE/StbE family toxin
VIKISWDQGFKKIYRKKVKNDHELKSRFWAAVKMFVKDPFQPRLRTHKLTGRLEGLWAFSVNFDCRVIFKFISKTEILLIDIGGHDEVY